MDIPDTKDVRMDILGVRHIHMGSSTWEAGAPPPDRTNGEQRLCFAARFASENEFRFASG